MSAVANDLDQTMEMLTKRLTNVRLFDDEGEPFYEHDGTLCVVLLGEVAALVARPDGEVIETVFDADDGDPMEVLVTVVDGRMDYWTVQWGEEGSGRTLADFDAWFAEFDAWEVGCS